MRNLKKFLALVLAMMMVFSLMITVNASHVKPGTKYGDDAKITSKYDEAIQVLSGLGIYKGYDGTTSTFRPGEPITRAEVTALVYRILSGDVNDNQVKAYEGYATANFTDVASGYGWARGYIGYVSNGLYVVGDGNGHFYPGENITGYEALAIILRAIGYDQWDEFKGPGWEVRVASTAQQLGILAKLDNSDGDLKNPATREVVAQMLFSAIAQCSTVNYDLVKLYEATNTTLAYQKFGLYGGGKVDGSAHTNLVPVGDASDFIKMTHRVNAEVDGKYDAPVAYWYTAAPASKTAASTIKVTFNPVLESHDTVKITEAYAAAVAAGAPASGGSIATGDVYYNVDGVALTSASALNGTDNALYATRTSGDKITGSGRGNETAVYVADGKVFVTVAKTWVNQVATAYSASPAVPFAMRDTTVNTYSSPYTGSLTKDTVVIYHQYANDTSGSVSNTSVDRIDTETIQAAQYNDETVNWTYDDTTTPGSWFKTDRGDRYYNANYSEADDNYLTQTILDRPRTNNTTGSSWDGSTESVFYANQRVYFDEWGYVVYTIKSPTKSADTGYFVLVDATYNNYGGANDYYVVYTGYDADGNPVSMKGATSPAGNTYSYGTPALANNATQNFDMGIYYGTKSLTEDRWALKPIGNVADKEVKESAATSINMGDPLALDGVVGADAGKDNDKAGDKLGSDKNILNDGTVFVIAEYNKSTGYMTHTVVKGFKNIKNMSELQAADKTGWTYTENTTWLVQWAGTTKADNDNVVATVDLVYIEGAKQEEVDAINVTQTEKFYLLDPYNKAHIDADYDVHTVVVNGVVQDMTFKKNLVREGGSATTDGKGWTGMNLSEASSGQIDYLIGGGSYVYGGIWTVYTRNNQNEVSSLVKGSGSAADVMTAQSGTWSYVAPGVIGDNSGNFQTLSKTCNVYAISTTAKTSKATTVDAIDADTVFFVETDGYGFVSMIYVID